jgi:Ca-activated chloride channel family protein
MYQFEEPHYLYLLLALPVLWLLSWGHRRWQRNRVKSLFDVGLLMRMAPNRSGWRPSAKFILQQVALLALIIGLAGPKVGTRLEALTRKGADVVFLLDVSRSMLVEDIKPNRLERARLIISRSIDRMAGDRLGIVAYAGIPVQLLPITNDYRAARMALTTADEQMISTQGTDIGDALQAGIKSFDERSSKNRLMVILSDGEDHEGGIEGALAEAQKMGVRIVAVGLGTPNGGPVPDKAPSGRVRGFLKGPDGEVAISRRDEETLRKLAAETGGEYLSGNRTQEAVDRLSDIFAGLEKTETESQMFTDFEHQFQWFFGLAFILLLLDAVITDKRSGLFDRWLKGDKSETL